MNIDKHISNEFNMLLSAIEKIDINVIDNNLEISKTTKEVPAKVDEFVIGILGGVGPAAGVYLHQEIILNTFLSEGKDQNHLEVFHMSRSNDIPDRSKFLLGEISTNPAEGMLRTLGAMYSSTKYLGQSLITAVPCGTFHSAPIFDIFLREANAMFPEVRILNMIDEIKTHLKERVPKASVIGLMSTTGTRNAGLYKKAFEPLGYTILEVEEDVQPELHEAIYNPVYGLKSVSPASTRSKRLFEGYVRYLKSKGAEAVILGCTEIPLALPKHSYRDVPLIDPLTSLARGLIRSVNPSLLAKVQSPDPQHLQAGLTLNHHYV